MIEVTKRMLWYNRFQKLYTYGCAKRQHALSSFSVVDPLRTCLELCVSMDDEGVLHILMRFIMQALG